MHFQKEIQMGARRILNDLLKPPAPAPLNSLDPSSSGSQSSLAKHHSRSEDQTTMLQ